MTTHQVDPGRVFVAGLSAGGAMAAVLAATYPDLYAAAGITPASPTGPPRRAAVGLRGHAPGAPAGNRRPRPGHPLIVFQGGRDTTVVPANAAALLGPWSRTATAEVTEGSGWTRRAYRDQERGEGRVVDRPPAGARLVGRDPEGSFADPDGPDASAELVRFFNDQTGEGASGDGRGRLALPRPLRSWFGGGR